MAQAQRDPIRPTDDEARRMARTIIAGARYGALSVLEPDSQWPQVSRVAVVAGPDGVPLTLVSELSEHTRAIRADPRCSLLLGEPGPKGDPLTHPRLTLRATAETADKTALKAHYLSAYPKARLYYDFGDFMLLRLTPVGAALNGGFGKAFRLTAEDILPPA